MRSTTRGTLAAVITGIAAAVGAAASPAAAVGTVPVPVPLEGAERALHMELPEVGGKIPVTTPGVPEAPKFVEGRLMPERVIPRVPVNGGLPGADLTAPVPHLLDDDFDHLGLDAPAADVRTLTPGLAVDAPLTAPKPGSGALPEPKLPEAGVLLPMVQAAPGADLTTGPGL
ncbi:MULTISPECIES: hypothetical protein [Streptomyces]|uniref:Secreted protein n=1 Tax=Streptomyces doebereineriae TaxID=3075528 RepID=A0ABU2VMT3_9ACTN|nr:hypothetical protein [Streptomyces sp. DSM 41640]MDT0486915.1 hypothetical protein [Streptomyces sp. DSM 41640]